MNIQIKATNISLTDSITDYVTKKLKSIERFVDAENPDAVCHIEVGKTTAHHKNGDVYRAEVRIALPGREVYVATEEQDLYAAIDAIKDDAQHALTSSKDKKKSMMRRSGAKIKDMVRGLWPAKKGPALE